MLEQTVSMGLAPNYQVQFLHALLSHQTFVQSVVRSLVHSQIDAEDQSGVLRIG